MSAVDHEMILRGIAEALEVDDSIALIEQNT